MATTCEFVGCICVTTLSSLTINWVTGSPPQCDILLAVLYPTYYVYIVGSIVPDILGKSFIVSHSSCAEQYGNMTADTNIHSLTHK